MRCNYCLNARSVISENGLHSICCLKDDACIKCMLGKEDAFIRNPMKKDKENS